MNQAGNSIVLIGMMGAGKSSVGDCLARWTTVPLHDTDEIIASNFGISIPEIFAKHGEDKFREVETDALRSLVTTKQAIIVTGGGVVLREENLGLLNRLGVLVWLHANEETLFERASRSRNRPLLQGENPKEAFARILQARVPLYAKIAQIRVDTSVLTDEEVAVAILSKLKKHGRNLRAGSPIPTTA